MFPEAKDARKNDWFSPVDDTPRGIAPLPHGFAKRYILDPLNAPEPSQETGLSASHANPRCYSVPPLKRVLGKEEDAHTQLETAPPYLDLALVGDDKQAGATSSLSTPSQVDDIAEALRQVSIKLDLEYEENQRGGIDYDFIFNRGHKSPRRSGSDEQEHEQEYEHEHEHEDDFGQSLESHGRMQGRRGRRSRSRSRSQSQSQSQSQSRAQGYYTNPSSTLLVGHGSDGSDGSAGSAGATGHWGLYDPCNPFHHTYHTPPASSSPTDRTFDFAPSNPFTTSHQASSSSPRRRSRQPPSISPYPRQTLRRSDFSFATPPASPFASSYSSSLPSDYSIASADLGPYPPHLTNPHYRRRRRHHRYPSTSASISPFSSEHLDPNRRSQRERAHLLDEIYNRGSPHARIPSDPTPTNSHHRQSSIRQRYPGDMSHRPLDVIKREAHAADRPHRRRKRILETDTIDALDTIGGPYHHGGPYDATLASRNLNKKYSPVAAVEESNMEAIRATPRANIIDSLTRHVPLQGTASIPAGCADLNGNIMEYEEGTDLMREANAPGGAYKRWDGIQYHPDDLKGKGEPSFSIERDLQKRKGHKHHMSESHAYEMRAFRRHHKDDKHAASCQRSVSQSYQATSSGTALATDDGHLNRSHSTGKKLSEGIKRRFGSLRRKKDLPSEAVH